MTVTLVLRLLRGPLAQNQLVGHAEIVATGVSHPVRGTADVIAVARAAARQTPEQAIAEEASAEAAIAEPAGDGDGADEAHDALEGPAPQALDA